MSLRNAKCKGTFIMHVIGYGFIMYLFKLLTLKLSFCNTIEHLYFFMIDIPLGFFRLFLF